MVLKASNSLLDPVVSQNCTNLKDVVQNQHRLLHFPTGIDSIKYPNEHYSGVSVLSVETKNQSEITNLELAEKTGSGTNYTQAILDYQAYMKKEGLSPITIEARGDLLRQMAKDVDLYDGEAVKQWIADSKAKGSTKRYWYATTYRAFAVWKGFDWKKPKVQNSESEPPFVPLTSELDQLIAGSGKTLAGALQATKETGCRPGELHRLRWKDLDTVKNTLTIIAEKGSKNRVVPISAKLINMLNLLKKDNPTIFSHANLNVMLINTRKRLANKLSNPRMFQITFRSIRHYYCTHWYMQLHDLAKTQQKTGHRSILSLMRYVHLAELELENSDQFHHASATTHKEYDDLVDSGWTYIGVTNFGNQEVHKFRKEKKWNEQ
jgi:integrase